jgi:hypothetical protein
MLMMMMMHLPTFWEVSAFPLFSNFPPGPKWMETRVRGSK